MEILRLSHADVTVTDLDLASASRTGVIGIVQLADVVVDGSLEGILKPDRRFTSWRPAARVREAGAAVVVHGRDADAVAAVAAQIERAGGRAFAGIARQERTMTTTRLRPQRTRLQATAMRTINVPMRRLLALPFRTPLSRT